MPNFSSHSTSTNASKPGAKGSGTRSIADIGEIGLISEIKKWCHSTSSASHDLRTGIGDDAALIEPKAGKQLLLCTDMLTEGVHFDLRYTPLQHLGYKAIVASVSDVVAMQGSAWQAVVGMALSSHFFVEDVSLLYEGIRLACNHCGLSIAGGDTVSSRAGLTLSVSLLGTVSGEEVVHRRGAAVGDLLCVTGDLGAAYVGLQALQQGQRYFSEHKQQPDLSSHSYVVGRYLKPLARTDICSLLREQTLRPTAMIDISDGLAADLTHICVASKVGACLRVADLPIDAKTTASASSLGVDPVEAACYGGEDYELLFTLPQSMHDKVRRCSSVRCIGEITSLESGIYTQYPTGEKRPLEAKGWNHFSHPNT